MPPWVGVIRSASSLILSMGSRSSRFRSMSSAILARGSSSSRTAVTFGWGMLLSTWLSTTSKATFRTWVAFALAAVPSGLMMT